MQKELDGKKIILGVTGSIAAYKSATLIRDLRKQGATVFVIMTNSATEFITPLTLENLSQNPVTVDMFDKNAQKGGAWHIHTANECDLMLIAPCSASTLSKIALGICDNALVTIATALPKDIPLAIAPAMDTTMYLSSAVQRNIDILKKDGVHIIPPAEGELSSGLYGPGRLPETEVLINEIKNLTKKKSVKTSPQKNKYYKTEEIQKFFENKKVLITAGPTVEKIDDVRYLTNRSSGKMGYALAEKALSMGADVTLISGPVNLTASPSIKLINVESAEEMFIETQKIFKDTDIAIFSAAVADYTPMNKVSGKIKKEDAGSKMNVELTETRDILLEMSKSKRRNQIVVGFALENSNDIDTGIKKLRRKKCDILVLNSLRGEHSGFEKDNNTIIILNTKGFVQDYPVLPKPECAMVVLESIRNY